MKLSNSRIYHHNLNKAKMKSQNNKKREDKEVERNKPKNLRKQLQKKDKKIHPLIALLPEKAKVKIIRKI